MTERPLFCQFLQRRDSQILNSQLQNKTTFCICIEFHFTNLLHFQRIWELITLAKQFHFSSLYYSPLYDPHYAEP